MKMVNKKTGAIILCLVIGFLATKSTDLQSALFHRTVMGGPMVALSSFIFVQIFAGYIG